jgi:uncharacterized phage-associated protein
MAATTHMSFCIECRKETTYTFRKRQLTKSIRGKEYLVCITAAICAECGTDMSIPGLLDKNVQEIDAQYREAEGLVTIDDIDKLMANYNIGKSPLSLALGFGEVTITRYLAGQIPSKEYSDIMKAALTSPAFMKELLVQNKTNLADAAYAKAIKAASDLEHLFSISNQMLCVISYVFHQLNEVTPLMLQKILYFIQGISLALYERPMFTEDCAAWVHGPVFPEVYHLFRDFKYHTIEDDKFAILHGAFESLTTEERHVIDLVLNTFGLYGGKVLEHITHNETPWLAVRSGCSDTIPSNIPISKDSIRHYYQSVNAAYDLTSEDGLRRYIHDMRQKPLTCI